MYPIRVCIEDGTLDIKEYDFSKDIFIGSNDKEYKLADIKYLVIPMEEMKKILNKSEKETSKASRVVKAK